MNPEIVALGSIIRLLFFIASFVPIAVLSGKYDAASGKGKKSLPFFIAYFALIILHYASWDYFILSGNFSEYLWSGLPLFLVISAVLFILAVSLLHFGLSRIYSQLFSQTVDDKRILTGLFGATIGAHVLLHYIGNPLAAFSLALYVSGWVSLSSSYALEAELYRKFKIRFGYFGYFGAAVSCANIIIFLVASSPDKLSTPELFYVLRLVSYALLLLGSVLSAIPAFFLAKSLSKAPEKLAGKFLHPIHLFIEEYSGEYAKIIGSVSYVLRDKALSEFRALSGRDDFSLEKRTSLSEKEEALLIETLVLNYFRTTGRLAGKVADDTLSENSLLAKEFSKMVSLAKGKIVSETNQLHP